MLGIKDPWIVMAYLVTIASAIVCVIYGYMNWNKGAEDESVEISEEAKWQQEETKVEDNL